MPKPFGASGIFNPIFPKSITVFLSLKPKSVLGFLPFFSLMALREVLRQQLSELISSMEQEGFVDFHFNIAHTVKKVDGPLAFIELVTTFRSDSQSTLRTLTQALDQPIINFNEMEQHCLKIKGSTSCLGIYRMALASGDLRQAICNSSKEECFLALNRMKHEFLILQEKFDLICQLERRIYSAEPGEA
ncbi:Histidine phosphotransferase [Parasponia andersonii]|uniref:Histidine-containing phosphotransfer protein n=1 Tax=Parasponia andersonii TaxID=3476 RepID=A0A2P5BCB8_PARAD|nr:Histidine phosphotransferase [Parasponia andersonii]